MDNLPNDQKCPYCGRYNNRRLAIDALIIRDNKILLVKRANDPFKDFWSNPGGGVDWGQTAEEAVTAEVKEETGLDVTDTKFLQIYTKPERDPNQVITLAYAVKATGEVKAGSDAKDAQWFDVNNLPKPLAFDHETIIEDYLQTM